MAKSLPGLTLDHELKNGETIKVGKCPVTGELYTNFIGFCSMTGINKVTAQRMKKRNQLPVHQLVKRGSMKFYIKQVERWFKYKSKSGIIGMH